MDVSFIVDLVSALKRRCRCAIDEGSLQDDFHMAKKGVTDKEVADVPAAIISNQYLDQLTYNTRSRPIPWEVCRDQIVLASLQLGLSKGGFDLL